MVTYLPMVYSLKRVLPVRLEYRNVINQGPSWCSSSSEGKFVVPGCRYLNLLKGPLGEPSKAENRVPIP